jgi:predicted dinucleotide-utilizing enzyme
VHDIEVVGEFGRFSIHLENESSETNPRTGKLTYFSTLAMLKALAMPLTIGT